MSHTDQPIPFIIGAPRSGTTLLRLMIDAHSEIAIPPETHFLPQVIEKAPASTDLAKTVGDIIIESERWSDFEMKEAVLRERLERSPKDLPSLLESFYLLYAQKYGKKRWGEKTPTYLFSMIALESVFPNAYFIHIIRDGRAVAASNIPLSWGPNTVQEAARWWAQCVQAARYSSGYVKNYMEVRYEDLVREPEQVLKEVCEFIHLPFEEEMLSYHTSAAERLKGEQKDVVNPLGGMILGEERKEIHLNTLNPPDQKLISRWQEIWSPAEQLQFEASAGDLLRELGYLELG